MFPPPRLSLLAGSYGEGSIVQGTPRASHILSPAGSMPPSLQRSKAPQFHLSSKEQEHMLSRPCETL